jgi:hypothetical protein
MRFWLREVFGWLLVGIGLWMFSLTYGMLLYQNPATGRTEPKIIEAGQWSIVGIIVFRGGIHLLKVAVAARVCTQVVEEISGDRPGLAARPVRAPVRTLPRV